MNINYGIIWRHVYFSCVLGMAKFSVTRVNLYRCKYATHDNIAYIIIFVEEIIYVKWIKCGICDQLLPL